MKLIKEQAAIEAVVDCTICETEDKLRAYCMKHSQENDWIGGLVDAIDAIKKLPSAQPEIIRCGECEYYKPMSNHWGKCGVHSSSAEKYRTCQICDYCSWSERRTDE